MLVWNGVEGLSVRKGVEGLSVSVEWSGRVECLCGRVECVKGSGMVDCVEGSGRVEWQTRVLCGREWKR